MSLEDYKKKFARLRVNVAHGRASPHKICMLLSLLDLARSGKLKQNRIEYDVALLDRYQQYFNAVKTDGDHANPYFPFFHLGGRLSDNSPSFWHLHAIPGREVVLDAMTTAGTHKAIYENVAYTSLDDELFALLQDESNIDALGAVLAEKWFDRGLQDLKGIAEQGSKISQYEHQLRDPDKYQVKELVPEAVRSPAFRRVVTEIYDYRCAATGLRFISPDGAIMVEAAHIHPFCESKDDDPRNGLALTPDMHWAMDKNLIAPGPDYKWHVSKGLDDRIPDNRVLTDLAGKKMFLPKEQRVWPKKEVLEWRLRNMS
jgi:putative restriction endonuclease